MTFLLDTFFKSSLILIARRERKKDIDWWFIAFGLYHFVRILFNNLYFNFCISKVKVKQAAAVSEMQIADTWKVF